MCINIYMHICMCINPHREYFGKSDYEQLMIKSWHFWQINMTYLLQDYTDISYFLPKGTTSTFPCKSISYVWYLFMDFLARFHPSDVPDSVDPSLDTIFLCIWTFCSRKATIWNKHCATLKSKIPTWSIKKLHLLECG